MSAFFAIVRRDLVLAVRQGGGAGLALAFFAGTILLVPLGIGAEAKLLAPLAPGMVWIAAALATLLSLDRLFQADYEDASLEQIALARLPLALGALAKCLAAWLSTGLPLALVSPLLALSLGMENGIATLALSLLIGTPGLTLAGAIAGALTAGVRRGGLVMSLIALPLYVPAVVFGAAAATAAANGLDAAPSLMILGALSLFELILAPFAAAAALRLHLE